MAINEKVAGVCFPGLDGKIDFGVGFIGSDHAFRSWSRDLFEHYRKSAEPVRFKNHISDCSQPSTQQYQRFPLSDV
jgi:predicted transcriptional regulator